MENSTGKFLAGYAKVDITPDYSVPLAGFGNTWRRMSQTVLSHLYIQCLAITDKKGTTMLLYSYDIVKVADGFFDTVAEHFFNAYGIEGKYIHINASHSESSPDTAFYDKEKCPMMPAYNEFVLKSFIEAGEEALKDRVPATLSYGSERTHNLNFVKHAFFTTGESLGDNKGRPSDGIIAQHTTHVDDLMLAVKVDRENKTSVTMVNWRAHNQFTSGWKKTDLSADYVGAFRDAAKEKLNTEMMFFQGCAGNVNPYSYIRAEERTRDFVEFGKMLAQTLYDIFQNLTPIDPGIIKAEKRLVTAKINHDGDELAEIGDDVYDFFKSTPDTQAAFAYAREKGFHSPFDAHMYAIRARLPKTEDYYVSVWSIGDLGFAATQFETFDTNGKWIRENSPFKNQFVLGYTDYPSGYMPSGYGFTYGCYEADNSRFAPGTGEMNAAVTLQMLVEMKYREEE